MPEDHEGLNNGRFDEEAFLRQCTDVYREREAMLFHELDRLEEGLLFCLFDTPDRVQHMFWRFREPDHPANRLQNGSGFEGVIEEQYRTCDATLGKVLEYADPRTLVIALSDHGFTAFRRGVHLNTWLYDEGWLALRKGMRPGDPAGEMLGAVDWSRTKAYALGLGGIYLNLKGREREGIVSCEERSHLQQTIASRLTQLTDAGQAVRPVRSAVAAEQLYRGPYAAEAPDLVVNFALGYRASWGTALGGVPAGHFEDNTRRWAGDHIVDPRLVPGVLFMNRPARGQNARLSDLAPTILEAFGVSKPAAMEGESLLT
jgi:predicted AlkP superfamily phosphohydrolase/phosphomutase